ncbi:MAG TPA: tetratricopeptide repeat protein, partial [Bacteroidia bacterium]|nr:tetratricopeptide repeat protein [Bacteroidia bacterium]
HSTNLQKNYTAETDSFHTTWHDMNVSCESCHGPGSKHIDFMQTDDYANGKRLKNSGFVYSNDTSSIHQLQTCAPCHARKSDIAADKMNSDEMLDDIIPQVISSEFYFADGQIDDEAYEYGSFTQSKMFHANVKCSNCHNPHSGKLKKLGNDLCLSCHQPSYNSEEHHFHKLNTESAQCVSCHMTSKTYMGNDHRRDHSFRIPRPDQSVTFGTPNACNGCHQDKSAKWSANAVEKWYGPTRKYHFSDDLVPGSLLNEQSEIHLIKLLKDTLQPEIARATAAHYLGSIATQQSANALIFALHDMKPLVRYQVIRALENFNSQVWMSNAYQCLSDPVRAVRIAAAGLYRKVPKESVPAEYRNAYDAADAENFKFLNYQTDFSVGNVMLADYSIQGGDNINAIKYYLRGLKKDSLMNYARLNLSAAYNSAGKNPEALKTLTEAAAIDPRNDRIFYNLGLLNYEMGDVANAMINFNGVYYNLGLLLQQQNKMMDAEKILLKGFQLEPMNLKINYALTYMYASGKNMAKAQMHARILQQNDPQNPEYQQLFKTLGL